MRKIFFILLLISKLLYAEDVKFEIKEAALNSFADAVGSIRGEESIKLFFVKLGSFQWEIGDINIDLKDGMAELSAKVAVEKKGERILGSLTGELVPIYEADKRQIVLAAKSINLSGINFLNIEKIFSPKFKIPVNLSEEEVEISVGGNRSKNIKIIPREQKIEILEDKLILSSKLEFEEAEI